MKCVYGFSIHCSTFRHAELHIIPLPSQPLPHRKGDYYRYMAEYATENEDFCAKSLAAYKAATDIALDKDGLPPTHPIRLGLLLNFSVFFYEVLGEKGKALFMAEEGFQEAITLMDNLSEENYKDTVLLMQLLRDNLTIWKADFEQDEQKALDG